MSQWGNLQRSPHPVAVFKATISKGRERRGKGKGRERERREGTEVIMGMERRGRVESGRKNKGPTITEGERRGRK